MTILPIVFILDLLIPFILAPAYKGYNHLIQVMSVLGNSKAPLHIIYNAWLVVFGITLKKSKKKLLDLVKLIDNKINELQDNVCTDLKNIPGAKVEYKKLLKKDIEWDKAEPDISSKESLEFITTVLAKIKVLIENQNNYRQDLINQKYTCFLENNMIETQLKDFIILDAIGDKKNEYDKKREKIEFINSIFEKIGQFRRWNLKEISSK